MIKKPVVIITGVSSGIGLATAQLFNEKSWVVIGTVRDRAKLPAELTTMALDLQLVEMTEPALIQTLVQQAHKTYGRIDAVVANAGYGLVGPLEKLTYEQLERQFAVNVLAVAELVSRVIPIFRRQRRGVVIAVSSIAGRVGIPSYPAYSASKFALEGMFEALWYEVKDAGIKLRLVEPSSVRTSFWTKGLVKAKTSRSARFVNRFLARTIQVGESKGLQPQDVARTIYKAAASTSDRLHYGVGVTGLATTAKRILPDRLFRYVIAWYIDR
jgi:short-subunit dehydrogenase